MSFPHSLSYRPEIEDFGVLILFFTVYIQPCMFFHQNVPWVWPLCTNLTAKTWVQVSTLSGLFFYSELQPHWSPCLHVGSSFRTIILEYKSDLIISQIKISNNFLLKMSNSCLYLLSSTGSRGCCPLKAPVYFSTQLLRSSYSGFLFAL